MTLDEWMTPVVTEFPRQVQQHLRAEYRAHYQDHLAAVGSEDALALFGDPAEAKRQLKKVYLTQDALELRPNLLPFTVGLLVLACFLSASLLLQFPQYASLWSVLGLVLVPIGAVWLWRHTSTWAPERQQSFRSQGLLALLMSLQAFNLLPLNGPRQQLQFWPLLVTVFAFVYTMFTRDARVHRTLNPTD